MKKNRARKRTLMFEQLETKATPAALLVALAPLDESTHELLEQTPLLPAPTLHEIQSSVSLLANRSVDPSGNWQFSHSVINLLRFVENNTLQQSKEPTVCSPPTWDQCNIAEEMMQLQDADLRSLVIAQAISPDNGETAATDTWL